MKATSNYQMMLKRTSICLVQVWVIHLRVCHWVREKPLVSALFGRVPRCLDICGLERPALPSTFWKCSLPFFQEMCLSSWTTWHWTRAQIPVPAALPALWPYVTCVITAAWWGQQWMVLHCLLRANCSPRLSHSHRTPTLPCRPCWRLRFADEGSRLKEPRGMPTPCMGDDNHQLPCPHFPRSELGTGLEPLFHSMVLGGLQRWRLFPVKVLFQFF